MSGSSEIELTHLFFWSGPFSQWQRCEFVLDGMTFNTAEQAMMYRKAMLFHDQDVAQKILKTRDAKKQKALGRTVKNFDPTKWDAEKEGVVREANRAKFGQNKGLRRKLFQTGTKMLVEASPLDLIWGIGLDEKNARLTPPEQWPGENLLGKILTEVRDELREIHPDEAAGVTVEGLR